MLRLLGCKAAALQDLAWFGKVGAGVGAYIWGGSGRREAVVKFCVGGLRLITGYDLGCADMIIKKSCETAVDSVLAVFLRMLVWALALRGSTTAEKTPMHEDRCDRSSSTTICNVACFDVPFIKLALYTADDVTR